MRQALRELGVSFAGLFSETHTENLVSPAEIGPVAASHQCPQYGSPTRAAGFDSEETAILIQTGLSKLREWLFH
jgi:hypothetical protein